MAKNKTVDQYKRLVKRYFDRCDSANAASGEKGTIAKPYTLSGLLCELGLTREEFSRLEKSVKGRELVRSALMKIEAFIEENALSGRLSSSAASNSLKFSLGWNEKESTTQEKSITVMLSDDAKKLGE